jgi:hypothetical protein
LGALYVDQGRADVPASAGRLLYEKALGRDHTSTPDTIDDLGIPYVD